MAVSASEERRAALRAQALPARVASGVGLGAVVLAAAWLGGRIFDSLLALTLGTALLEYLRMARGAGHPVPLVSSLALGGALLLYTLVPDLPGSGWVALGLGAVFLIGSLRAPISGRVIGLALGLFGVAYVLGLGLQLHELRHLADGRALLVVLLLATWAADTAAFFVGVRWGRRRLAPAVSPGKSLEGLVAGCLAAVLVGAVGLVSLAPGWGWGRGLALGVAIAVGAPVGDLFESLLKRNFEVKDSSRIIPGHGGVLDRVDSLLVAGAATLVLARVLGP